MIRLNKNTIFIKKEDKKLQMVTSEVKLIRLVKEYKDLTSYLIILKALNDTQKTILKMDKIADTFYNITGQDIATID